MYLPVGVFTIGPLQHALSAIFLCRVPLIFLSVGILTVGLGAALVICSFPIVSREIIILYRFHRVSSPMTTDPLNLQFEHRLLGSIVYVAYIADAVYVFDRGIHGGS